MVRSGLLLATSFFLSVTCGAIDSWEDETPKKIADIYLRSSSPGLGHYQERDSHYGELTVGKGKLKSKSKSKGKGEGKSKNTKDEMKKSKTKSESMSKIKGKGKGYVQHPTKEPTKELTKEPTKAPTKAPTKGPTQEPTKAAPSLSPSAKPTDCDPSIYLRGESGRRLNCHESEDGPTPSSPSEDEPAPSSPSEDNPSEDEPAPSSPSEDKPMPTTPQPPSGDGSPRPSSKSSPTKQPPPPSPPTRPSSPSSPTKEPSSPSSQTTPSSPTRKPSSPSTPTHPSSPSSPTEQPKPSEPTLSRPTPSEPTPTEPAPSEPTPSSPNQPTRPSSPNFPTKEPSSPSSQTRPSSPSPPTRQPSSPSSPTQPSGSTPSSPTGPPAPTTPTPPPAATPTGPPTPTRPTTPPTPAPNAPPTLQPTRPPVDEEGRRDLTPYVISYNITNDSVPLTRGVPFTTDYVAVVNVTDVFLRDYFTALFSSINFSTLDYFETIFLNTVYRQGQPIEMKYESTAFFGKESSIIPSSTELDALLKQAFLGQNLANYTQLLQGLNETNPFSNTTSVKQEFSTSSSSVSNTESQNKNRIIGAMLATAAAVAALFAIGIFVRRWRRKREDKSLVHGHFSFGADDTLITEDETMALSPNLVFLAPSTISPVQNVSYITVDSGSSVESATYTSGEEPRHQSRTQSFGSASSFDTIETDFLRDYAHEAVREVQVESFEENAPSVSASDEEATQGSEKADEPENEDATSEGSGKAVEYPQEGITSVGIDKAEEPRHEDATSIDRGNGDDTKHEGSEEIASVGIVKAEEPRQEDATSIDRRNGDDTEHEASEGIARVGIGKAEEPRQEDATNIGRGNGDDTKHASSSTTGVEEILPDNNIGDEQKNAISEEKDLPESSGEESDNLSGDLTVPMKNTSFDSSNA